MTAGGAFDIRPYEPADEAGVLNVLQAAFGEWPGGLVGATPEGFFRWKHLQCPFGPSIMLVAVSGGQVVGFNAYMRWGMRAGERAISATRGVDLAVHPAHRGRGVAMALMRTAKEHLPEEVVLSWSNPNQLSHPRAVRAGRANAGRITQYSRPHLPLRLRRHLASPRRSRSGELRIEAATAAEALAGETLAWPGASPARRLRLATVKDAEFLRWRYSPFTDHFAVRDNVGDSESGIAIFRVRRYGPFLVTNICELLVAPGDRRAARRLVKQVRKAVPVSSINAIFPSWLEAASCGFLQPAGGAPIVVQTLAHGVLPDPTRRSSWALSLGDLELI